MCTHKYIDVNVKSSENLNLSLGLKNIADTSQITLHTDTHLTSIILFIIIYLLRKKWWISQRISTYSGYQCETRRCQSGSVTILCPTNSGRDRL